MSNIKIMSNDKTGTRVFAGETEITDVVDLDIKTRMVSTMSGRTNIKEIVAVITVRGCSLGEDTPQKLRL